MTTSVTEDGKVLVKWAPPLEHQQNGFIDKYAILVTDQITGDKSAKLVDSSLLQYDITNLLQPEHSYDVEVRAHNRNGFGPTSPAVSVALPPRRK